MTKRTRPIDPEELLAAWAHRPADLTAEERRAVDALVARSPTASARADDERALIARVADLPAEGTEPAWDDLERSIRAACDAAPPGWRARVRAALRGGSPAAGLGAGLVVATAAFALWLGGDPDRGLPAEVARDDASDRALAGLAALGRDEDALVDDLPDEEPAATGDDEALLADWGAPASDDLLGDPDLEWIDTLDDAELDAVAAWLDAQESG